MHTISPSKRRIRTRLVLLLAIGTLIGAACSPAADTGGGAGGTYIPFGPITIPLPPIGVNPPAQTLISALCNVQYQPTSFNIIGATVTIPGILINPGQEIISVPNVVVNIPQLIVGSPAAVLQCPLGLTLSTQVNVIVPSQFKTVAAVLNLQNRTITLNDPSFTLTGVGLGVPGLGQAIIPLPPIVTVPFGSASFSF